MSKEISELQYEDIRRQIGHYKKIDYHPEIRPAGIVTLAEGLEDCFKDYKLEDGVNALKFSLNTSEKYKENESKYSSKAIGTPNPGIYTGVKSCLEMNKQQPFESLIAELKNTSMNSYWKKEVGKIPDQTPNLPEGIDQVLTIFGKITKSDGNAAELVNPSKTAAEVIAESRIGHALYKKSHNDYYPSEQVDRNYIEPFNKRHTYGKETTIDKLGGRVKRSMRWFNQNVASTVSSLQADFLEDTQPRLGCSVIRGDIVPVVDGRTFGKINEHDSYGAGDLIRDSLPSNDKSLQKQYLKHINILRLYLKKHTFPFMDLYQTFIYYDTNKTETMTMGEIYQILGMFQIHPDKKMFEALLNVLNLIEDDKVSYKAVTDILNWKCDFPSLPKINDVPLEYQNYCSTYQDTICNAYSTKGKPCHTAGLSSERVDVPYAVVPAGRPRCEKESLGDQTSVAAILSPNIFTQNGLSHIDFFKIRKAHEIRELLSDIGVDLPDNSFDILWKEGLKKDCTAGVCIETFRGLLDQLAAVTCEEIPVA